MAHASRPSAVGRGTLAFLYGLCEVEELPGSYLVEVFGALNMSASGARSYLARAVADGRLVSHRRGRQTAYALNGTFLRRYRTIEQRFISRPDWEGRFHIVIYDIPETRRSERDALRAAAFADGWASPRPGVLLGMRPPGGWAECAGCSAGRLDVDLAAWVLGQVVVAAVSLALNAGRAPLAAQIFAVAAMPLWYAVHVSSGFARAEHLAEGGPEDVPEREIKRFLRLNLPIHCGYAAVYVAAALWLLAGLL